MRFGLSGERRIGAKENGKRKWIALDLEMDMDVDNGLWIWIGYNRRGCRLGHR